MLIRKFICPSLMVIAVCLGASVAARADQVVFQATFNETSSIYPYPAGPNVGNPDSFSVVQGPVYYVGGFANDPTNPCDVAGGPNVYCLELPSAGQAPELSSNVSIGPGSYLVDLQIAGGSSDTAVLVTLNNFQLFPVTAGTHFTDYLFTTTIPVGESSHLQVQGRGLYINSITVTQQPDLGENPVPEPSSWALMLTAGLGSLGVAARQRFKTGPLPVPLKGRP